MGLTAAGRSGRWKRKKGREEERRKKKGKKKEGGGQEDTYEYAGADVRTPGGDMMKKSLMVKRLEIVKLIALFFSSIHLWFGAAAAAVAAAAANSLAVLASYIVRTPRSK